MEKFNAFHDQVKTLETFLREVQKATLEDQLHTEFPGLVKRLREAGFYCYPTTQKSPPRHCKFKLEEDKIRANSLRIETEASLDLPPWLAVFDIDEPELFFETYGVSREEIEKVATVRTRRGYHIYLFDPQETFKHRSKKNGWELKRGSNKLCILPGSRMADPDDPNRSVRYEVLNPRVYPFEELPEWLLQVLEEAKKEKEETPKALTPQRERVKGEVSVDWERLKAVVEPFYKEGQRQNLHLYLGGWLYKKGVSVDEIKAFSESLAKEMGDDEFDQREGALAKTLTKDPAIVKGWKGLTEELGIPEGELEACIIHKGNSSPDQKQGKSGVLIITRRSLIIKDVAQALISFGLEINYDLFFNKFFLGDEEITEKLETEIHALLESYFNKRLSRELVQQAIAYCGYQNERDRLREYLDTCYQKWDKKRRIESFFSQVFGVPEEEYSCSVARYFFLSAVARAYSPGCFVKSILVLQGPQNYNKSRVLSALGGEWHREINVSITSEKDFFMAIQGVWIAELPEMEALQKADRNRIKAIISSTIDRFRPPYSKLMQDFPRRCVFTCTTNDDEIYDDPTGGARYLPIRVHKKGDVEWVLEHRDLLWGEAVHRYLAGEKFWEIDEELAKKKQLEVARFDEWASVIAEKLDELGVTQITIREIATEILSIPLSQLSKSVEMRIADILKQLGWERTFEWSPETGKNKRVWKKKHEATNEATKEGF